MSRCSGMIVSMVVVGVCFLGTCEVRAEGNSLSTNERRIVPIAAHVASGNLPELETALHEGLDAGLTVNEIKELMVHAYAYAGFPRALNGINAFMAVVDERIGQGIIDSVGSEATAMPTDLDRAAVGNRIRNLLVGRDISNRTEGYPAFVPVIDRFLVEHLFADIFYRDVLSHRERELATISMLAEMTGTEPQLKAHMQIAMNVGLSELELEDYISVLRSEVSAESAAKAAGVLNDLVGSGPLVEEAKSVRVTRRESPTDGNVEYFSGRVSVESRFSSEESGSYRGGIVNFEAGARTAWHTLSLPKSPSPTISSKKCPPQKPLLCFA